MWCYVILLALITVIAHKQHYKGSRGIIGEESRTNKHTFLDYEWETGAVKHLNCDVGDEIVSSFPLVSPQIKHLKNDQKNMSVL